MQIKLIAADMNGTFLDNDQHFDQSAFKQLLNKLADRNILFAVSSGNQYAHLQKLFKGINGDNLIMIAENGASIFRNQQQIFDGSLSADQLAKFLKKVRPSDLFKSAYVILTGSHGSYTETGAPEALMDAARKFYDNFSAVPDLAAVKEPIKKISLNFPPHQAPSIDEINAALGSQLRAHDSGYGVIDVVAANVGKLPAVQWLEKQLHIQPAEVVAFGDGANDLELLSHAGMGYAMKNAAPEVKQAAKYVTQADNEHNGVIQTILDLIK